jgi:hypothetical protein
VGYCWLRHDTQNTQANYWSVGKAVMFVCCAAVGTVRLPSLQCWTRVILHAGAPMDDHKGAKPSRLLTLQQQFQRKLTAEKEIALEAMRQEVRLSLALCLMMPC